MPYVDKEENYGLSSLFIGVEINRFLTVTTQIVTPVQSAAEKIEENCPRMVSHKSWQTEEIVTA
ncbi:MAG TPA: hypothetical protein VNN62_17930 [Methylomirabilota bacterium]|jgi:hypothetical protein|nr:hypothetical protein [Methylomirabilota bacterium]